jgi:bleomycin hydrolase
MKEIKNDGLLTPEMITKYRKKFNDKPAYKVAMNAVTRAALADIAINRDVLNNVNFCFSIEVETDAVSDQKRSGTCWMFAILNWFRTFTRKKINVKQFEYSHNFVMFWDKFEKSNYFLENIIALRDADISDRRLRFLLDNPASDGGEWHMLVNVIKKYGLLPRSAMPDTTNRENSRYLNELLFYKLREAAATLRKLNAEGKDIEDLRKAKSKILQEIYRMLCILMGQPPEKFDYSYRDNDKKFKQDLGLTPKEFYEKYVGLNVDEIYCILSCPATDTPFDKTYSIEFFDNTVGGDEWKWLNVPVKELKKIAIEMLKDGEAVLFGNDVVQDCHTKEGILATNVYDYELLFDTKMTMDKKTRVEYAQSRMTHSMVITGVDLVDDKPVKWKVENSWGEEVGKKGYFIMTDEWFEEHTFDLIVPKKYMPEKFLKLYKQKPVVLPPWYPMA